MIAEPQDVFLPQYLADVRGDQLKASYPSENKIPCTALRILAVPCAMGLIMIGLMLIKGGV